VKECCRQLIPNKNAKLNQQIERPGKKSCNH